MNGCSQASLAAAGGGSVSNSMAIVAVDAASTAVRALVAGVTPSLSLSVLGTSMAPGSTDATAAFGEVVYLGVRLGVPSGSLAGLRPGIGWRRLGGLGLGPAQAGSGFA